MHERLELLRPQSPVRMLPGEEAARLLAELLQAGNSDMLAAAIERIAPALTAARAARLEWLPAPGLALHAPASEREASIRASADGQGSDFRLPLLPGQGWLHLEYNGTGFPDERLPQICLLIDVLALRLREVLAEETLRASLAAAQRSEHLQHALYAIADLAYADMDRHEMLARVHAVVAELTYAENFYIALYDDSRDVMRFAYYVDAGDSPMSRAGTEVVGRDYPNSLTFAVLHSGRSLLGPSRELRTGMGLGNDSRLGPECIDWLGVPMLEGERVRGAVVVQSYDPARRYSEEDRILLSFVAQHIHTALARKQEQDQLEAEVQRRTAELAEANRELREEVAERERGQRLQAALFRIAERSVAQGSLEEFLGGVHGIVGELLYARNFYVALLSADGSRFDYPYAADEEDEDFASRPLGRGLTEYTLRQGRAILIDEKGIEELCAAGEVERLGPPAECWLGVPLIEAGRPVGVLVVQSYTEGIRFSSADRDLLTFVCLHIATALERRQAQERLQLAYAELEQRVEERTRELQSMNNELREQIAERERIESRLKHQALHDALTGLPNRAALLDRLALALSRYRRDHERQFAVLFLDLDRFKIVNDSVGHLVGDRLLVEAGQRIAACLREPDSVARLGGDEFAILIEDIHGVDDATHIAGRVLAALVDPIRIEDKEVYTSASIGITLVNPRYTRAEELLRDADVAMYRAKSRGRQRYEVFDQQLREEALLMLDLESDLRRAIARREFEPFLQPIVRLNDGAVLGYEALLRWRHGERGLLLPADFLSVAEESGNLEQIDWLLYEQVFRAIPGLTEKNAYVGINVSARHFRSSDLAGQLLGLLQAFHVAPGRVRIEVTEGALLENPELACNTMLRLRDAGVLTSLDDFGTGYSSLSYLHRFPLHALKIDRSFIADLGSDASGNSAAVVRAILALASSLNMEVIAEGVETTLQRGALLQLDCRAGQGYLFAQPRPLQELTILH
jgi:diguanylate cyclase (GGDEF)-like protein